MLEVSHPMRVAIFFFGGNYWLWGFFGSEFFSSRNLRTSDLHNMSLVTRIPKPKSQELLVTRLLKNHSKTPKLKLGSMSSLVTKNLEIAQVFNHWRPKVGISKLKSAKVLIADKWTLQLLERVGEYLRWLEVIWSRLKGERWWDSKSKK